MRGSTPLKRRTTTKTRGRRAAAHLSEERIAEMIEEATVDAYDEMEQATGWYTMFEQHLELPFETKVLGIAVSVASIAPRDGGQIVAICTRDRSGTGRHAPIVRGAGCRARCRDRSRTTRAAGRTPMIRIVETTVETDQRRRFLGVRCTRKVRVATCSDN
jgi:hypothetical protein